MVWVDYMRTLSNPSSAKTNDLLHLQNTPLLKPTTDCPIIAKGAVMVANCNRQDRYLLPVWESAHLAAARAYSKPGMGMGLRLNESMTHPPPPRWRPELQKVGDTGDISLLFFSAGANFWVILGHFWAILAIFGHFWAILGNFRSFLGHFLVLIFCGKICLCAI